MNALIEAPASVAEFDRARAWWIERIGEPAYESVRARARRAADDQARRAVDRVFARALTLMEASEPSRPYLEFALHFAGAVRVAWRLSAVATLGRNVSQKTIDKEHNESTALAAELYKQQASEENKGVRAKAIAKEHFLVFNDPKRPSCASCTAADGFEALATADIWDVLTPPIHSATRCSCKVTAREHSSLRFLGDPPLTEAQQHALADYLKKQVMAVEVAMKRAANTEVEAVVNGKKVKKTVGWIKAPDGTMLPTRFGSMGMGPCLSVAVDATDPRKIAFRVNQNALPNPLPDCLKQRIERIKQHQASYYQTYSTAEQREGANAPRFEQGYASDYGHPGHHSEVHAVAALMAGGDCSQLANIAIFNVRLDGIPLEYGVDMPCCRHCAYVLGDGGEPEPPKEWESEHGAWRRAAEEAAATNKPPPKKPERGVPGPVDHAKGVMKLADAKAEGGAWAKPAASNDDGTPLHDSIGSPAWKKEQDKVAASKAKTKANRKSRTSAASKTKPASRDTNESTPAEDPSAEPPANRTNRRSDP